MFSPLPRVGPSTKASPILRLELQAKSLASIITRLSFHLSKTGKCRFKVAFVGLFVRPYEKVVRLGFSKAHLVIR